MSRYINKKTSRKLDINTLEGKLVKLSSMEKKYKDEWLAFLVIKNLKNGDCIGKLVAHNKDRHKLHQEIRKKRINDIYTIYAGKQELPILL
jgi:hypothetical protein